MNFSIVAPAGDAAVRPAHTPPAQTSTRARRILLPPMTKRRVGIDASQAIAVRLHAGEQAIRRPKDKIGSSRGSATFRRVTTMALTCDRQRDLNHKATLLDTALSRQSFQTWFETKDDQVRLCLRFDYRACHRNRPGLRRREDRRE